MITHKQNFVLIDDDQEEYQIFVAALSELNLKASCKYFDNWDAAFHYTENSKSDLPCFFIVDLLLNGSIDKSRLERLKNLVLPNGSVIVIYSAMTPTDEMWKMISKYNFQFLKKGVLISELRADLQRLIDKESNCV